MNKEIKRKWIKALRSGKYKQTRAYLKKRNGSMCCLGVLEHKVLGVPYRWDGVYRNAAGSVGEVSCETLGATGLCRTATYTLVRLNDKNKMSFSKIADWIEKNL